MFRPNTVFLEIKKLIRIIANHARNRFGTPNTLPAAIAVNPFGSPEIVFAPVIRRIIFRTIVIDAIVAINGGTFASNTSTPLKRPTSTLARIAIKIETITPIPDSIHMDTIIPDSPTTEPTEISIPEEVMTNTIPIAMIP